MKSRLNPYKSLPLLACLFLLLAFGCTGSEQGGNGDPDLPEMVEVDLQVGVSDVSRSLQTKAEAPDALPGEQIHSLVVFIVDASGKVEKKFEPNLTGTAADNGELEKWTSGSFDISAGPKRIYAFANWESLEDYSFISTQEGVTLTLPNTVKWTNHSFKPADKKFLPMSVQEEWNPVSEKTGSVQLIRLVSRLQVKVTNETIHDITIKKLNIEQFNTECNLFNGMILPTTKGWNIPDVFKDRTLSGSNDPNPRTDAVTSTESMWYYVNESETTDGFKVELETESQYHTDNNTPGHGGTKYTSRHRIPRNHVWNLEIKFTSYQLTLSVQGENPPIGGYPDIMTGGTTNLTCEVLGGGPFTITVEKLESTDTSETLDNIKWEIANIRNPNNLLVENPVINEVSGKTQIKGRMAGAIENAKNGASFDLIAKRSDGTVLVTFLVQLRFADIFQPQP